MVLRSDRQSELVPKLTASDRRSLS